MEKPQTKTSRVQFFSYVLIAFLTLEVGLLLKQNREMKAMLSPPPPEILKANDRIVPLRVQTLDGTIETLDFTSSPKNNLELVLSTSCPARFRCSDLPTASS